VITVLLVDDQALMRAGFRALLDAEDGLEVVGEAADGASAVDLARRLRPDVVLMDVQMPGLDGIEATRRIAAEPDLAAVRVLILTNYGLDSYVFAALRAGASGFLLKDTPPADIVRAVRAVAAGEPMLSPTITRRLIGHVTDGETHDRQRHAREQLDRLTEREREVAVAVGLGKSNAEIGRELYMSVATVKSHVSRVLEKLEFNNRVQIALLAHDAGEA
jgi:DNA-binding NarL/FixJ family response regulator